MGAYSIAVAPVVPASPIPLYPRFADTVIPPDSGAVHAYRGFIRPFSDDATARRVLRAIHAGQPLIVSEGRLDFSGETLPKHELEDYLIDMAVPCTVVVLEFPAPRHHAAYLIDPIQEPLYSGNPHTWWGRTKMKIDGIEIPELCVYSGNLFQYDAACERLPQFLNQLSTYLAKHLIYLRTRMLHSKLTDGTFRKMRVRKPWEPVKRSTLKLVKGASWRGTWLGPAAPNGPAQHLATVDPDGECWCNSGGLYRDCHMKDDQTRLGKTVKPPKAA